MYLSRVFEFRYYKAFSVKLVHRCTEYHVKIHTVNGKKTVIFEYMILVQVQGMIAHFLRNTFWVFINFKEGYLASAKSLSCFGFDFDFDQHFGSYPWGQRMMLHFYMDPVCYSSRDQHLPISLLSIQANINSLLHWYKNIFAQEVNC